MYNKPEIEFIPRSCQWIIDHDYSMCGDRVVKGRPYCSEHTSKAYQLVDGKQEEEVFETIIKESKLVKVDLDESIPDI